MKKISIALIIFLLLTSKVITQESSIIKDLSGKYKLSYNLKPPGQKYKFLHEKDRPVLTLLNNLKFTMTVNYCQGMYTAEGSYIINGDILYQNNIGFRCKEIRIFERAENFPS